MLRISANLREGVCYHEAAEATCGVTGCGACRLSISKGWPGPQPVTNTKIIAIRTSEICNASDGIGHFLNLT